MAGIGGTIESAYLCQSFSLGGGTAFSLQGGSASPCLGGATYATFYRDPAGPTYSIEAGQYIPDPPSMEPSTWTDVTFASSTGGTVSGDMRTLDDVPADTSVTLTTGEFVIVLMMSGSTVTITAFDPA
jgi:hypothetical protein